MTIGFRVLVVAFALALGVRGEARAQTAVLAGTTSFVEHGIYKPLDGVRITIYRVGPVTAGDSKNKGQFDIPFASGPPVYALFKGPSDQLPALQSLKAEAGTHHDVHVTLYTVAEARRQGINPYGYVKAILDQLAAVGVKPDDPQVKELQALMSKLG